MNIQPPEMEQHTNNELSLITVLGPLYEKYHRIDNTLETGFVKYNPLPNGLRNTLLDVDSEVDHENNDLKFTKEFASDPDFTCIMSLNQTEKSKFIEMKFREKRLNVLEKEFKDYRTKTYLNTNRMDFYKTFDILNFGYDEGSSENIGLHHIKKEQDVITFQGKLTGATPAYKYANEVNDDMINRESGLGFTLYSTFPQYIYEYHNTDGKPYAKYIGTVTMLHTWAYYGFFKPDIGEVIMQMPEIPSESSGNNYLCTFCGCLIAGMFHIADLNIYEVLH